jgi:hypothetical protein
VEVRRTVYISAVLGGGGACADVEAAIRELAAQVHVLDEQLAEGDRSNEIAVDVTFHVPGTILRPDYEGVRTGRWVGAKRLLVVQVATPDEVSGDAERVSAFLTDSLREAIRVASEHVARRRPALSTKAANAVVAAVIAARS